MNVAMSEREYLDQQEALARAGIERAVRGLGVDVMDALSLPKKLREHALFEAGVNAAANAIGSKATLELIQGAVLAKVSAGGTLSGILRQVCLESLSKVTAK